MLKTTLLHPGILKALGMSGHGSRILIADGNYPFATGTPPGVEMVFLNLRPGIVSVADVLETVVTAVSIESASVMSPPEGRDPPIFDDFMRILPPDIRMERLGRFDFYARARELDTSLLVATGEQQRYANILLTIGVIVSQ